jgi:uncharacterized membrane protein
MNRFIQGALVMGCLIITGFFIRFWRKSRDRLFLFFATAFLLLGVNWAALSFSSKDEPNTELYVVRLIAFVVIVIGIFDKNRSVSANLNRSIDQTHRAE